MNSSAKNKWNSQQIQKKYKNKHKSMSNNYRYQRNIHQTSYSQKQKRENKQLIRDAFTSEPNNKPTTVTDNVEHCTKYDKTLIAFDKSCKAFQNEETRQFKPESEEIYIIA
eukprot:746398_1